METIAPAGSEKRRPGFIQCREHRLTLGRPLVMGVLNVTPDSFSDGGLFLDIGHALERARAMVEEGADIIDVGGESSRPGAEPVPEAEELRRVTPVIERARRELEIPLSVDTRKARVADECLARGAHMINDISGLADDKMAATVSRYGAALVIMHMKGEPRTMQEKPVYRDVVGEIKDFLEQRIGIARSAGVKNIIIDPGIGFGKTVAHNLRILARLDEFRSMGCPIMVGPSRKSFIGALTGEPPSGRLGGTVSACAAAILRGADIIRVHDVRECRQGALVADAIRRAYHP